MINEYPMVLLPDEACEILRICKGELYALLNAGELKGYRVGKGKNWRIPKDSIHEFLVSQCNSSIR